MHSYNAAARRPRTPAEYRIGDLLVAQSVRQSDDNDIQLTQALAYETIDECSAEK